MINFELETTTVWSFENRSNHSIHNSKYRGNFAPQIANNVLKKYSKEGDLVLDPMFGGGTTLIEANLLRRRSIGLDINPLTISSFNKNIKILPNKSFAPSIYLGDTRELNMIDDCSIDLILTHPPYLDIIKYSDNKIANDLSNINSLDIFLFEFDKAVKEYFRVLKPNSYCAIVVGDVRRQGNYIPLAFSIMQLFINNCFILKEDIIKIQHNCSETNKWIEKAKKYNFHLIMHEHLFILRKTK